MKNDSLPLIDFSLPLIDLQYAAGFPAGRIVSGAPIWQLRIAHENSESRDAVAESAAVAPRRSSRKAAAGWLAAALLFTGAASPPAQAAASRPTEDAAPEMSAG
ncbi:hypothetical protein VSX64_09065 [Aurantimonas sp. C2-6-R+9]|uniref:hypothetical protein n=1 Tax=unclassified Aurantimonas TaxID=2638230 RepID=UPI002E1773ED|nr:MULTISPECIES: hypothetical protein [unclassified Aurantimonas]MEC5290851.1 hypothetical protein [Aurantimonas sp. C2-3-R2]MEC5324011.1 hypothetical protein [Aurantimonas sp. A3-2-R12]MEC5381028.1 hypothetical protein [Aurantimonas sp. C2-6-R+9]MEC5412001.1 hypothetical protein [Aurantimonas sp. C2-4-R8]